MLEYVNCRWRSLDCLHTVHEVYMLGIEVFDWMVIVAYLVGITFIGLWAVKKGAVSVWQV